MKSIDAVSSVYITFLVKTNDRHSTFNVSGYVRISKYNNIFAKGYIPKLLRRDFLILKKVENFVPCTWIISELNSSKIVKHFYVKKFRVEQEIKRKCDTLSALNALICLIAGLIRTILSFKIYHV